MLAGDNCLSDEGMSNTTCRKQALKEDQLQTYRLQLQCPRKVAYLRPSSIISPTQLLSIHNDNTLLPVCLMSQLPALEPVTLALEQTSVYGCAVRRRQHLSSSSVS